ncbi:MULTISPECIES: hypothetical protein [unclassified Bradyrhizobium]|uniref:hypothetical protein n=1 Tax=unclassified Bradyrhizobium TaxID=2631580 RepID=UPI0028E60536|nr:MULTISPECIES: hypothetical protein [unclassified Bradyrhizobium]
MAESNQRIILLNRLISRSVSRAPREHKPPLLKGAELFDIIAKSFRRGHAVEFVGLEDDRSGEEQRLARGAGHDCYRLRNFRIDEEEDGRFAVMLFEFIDDAQKSFPLVDLETFAGREISGREQERGASSAHVVVRLPNGDEFDEGNYRCAFESVQPITRMAVERFLNRQIRRDGEQVFTVTTIKDKKVATKDYRFHGRFNLAADLARSMATSGGKTLSQIVFTKRSERQSIGHPTAVHHEDVVADIEVKISGKQAPSDPKEQVDWLTWVRKNWETRGYQTKLYYRYASGGLVGGRVHRDIENAHDLMLCPREFVTLSKPPKRWSMRVNSEMVSKLKELLRKDDLWQQAG